LRDRGGLPPMIFQDLLAGVAVPKLVRAAIDRLLQIKSETSELGAGPRIAELDTWILAQIEASEDFCQAAEVREPALSEIDAFYRAQIGF
jgi:predicted nucleotidyltransferase